jgi:hypothetical protein
MMLYVRIARCFTAQPWMPSSGTTTLGVSWQSQNFNMIARRHGFWSQLWNTCSKRELLLFGTTKNTSIRTHKKQPKAEFRFVGLQTLTNHYRHEVPLKQQVIRSYLLRLGRT